MSGALAFFSPPSTIRVYSVPRIVRKVHGKDRAEVDPDVLLSLLTLELAGEENIKVLIEAGVGDRRQSSSAAYNYGFTNGAVWMSIRSKLPRLAVDFVHPSVWKRHFNLIGKDKDASRRKAQHVFPGTRYFDKASDHNKAEAALIAKYAEERPVFKPAAAATAALKKKRAASNLIVEP